MNTMVINNHRKHAHMGDLCMTEAILFKEHIQTLHTEGLHLEVDLTAAEKIDLVGINSMAMLHNHFSENGAQIIFTITENGPVHDVLKLTKFDSIFFLQYA